MNSIIIMNVLFGIGVLWCIKQIVSDFIYLMKEGVK